MATCFVLYNMGFYEKTSFFKNEILLKNEYELL